MFAYALAKGASGGASLPAADASDNGKMLKVVGGAWTKASVPETLVVHAEAGTGVRNVTTFTITDATVAQILAARANGSIVWLHVFVPDDFFYDGMDKYLLLPLTAAQTTDGYTVLIFSGYVDLGDGPVLVPLTFENSLTAVFDPD